MIHDLPISERPRERLLAFGASSLSNSELIAILLSSGSKDESAISLASKVLALEDGLLNKLSIYEPEEFMTISGIGKAKACSLVAAMELGRRIATFPIENRICLDQSDAAANLFMEEMRFLHKETVRIAMLDVKLQLIGKATISIGSLSDAAANPREVFAPAIKKGAAAIILFHNHPSSDCYPSRADIACTKNLISAGKIMGIEVLDHIIIGNNSYISMREVNKELF